MGAVYRRAAERRKEWTTLLAPRGRHGVLASLGALSPAPWPLEPCERPFFHSHPGVLWDLRSMGGSLTCYPVTCLPSLPVPRVKVGDRREGRESAATDAGTG